MSQDPGIEVHVPGVAAIKNLKEKHLNLACSLVLAVAMSFGAFFMWQHDTQAATERRDIASKIEEGNKQVQKSLAEQRTEQRLQTCILFLSLPPEQQARIRAANPTVCQ